MRSRAGQRADADELDDRREPVGLGQQRDGAARGRATQLGRPRRACHAPTASTSRENERRQLTAG